MYGLAFLAELTNSLCKYTLQEKLDIKKYKPFPSTISKLTYGFGGNFLTAGSSSLPGKARTLNAFSMLFPESVFELPGSVF